MPNHTKLIPLKTNQKWRRQAIHFNRDEWSELLNLSEVLNCDNVSSIIKTSIHIAKTGIPCRRMEIKKLKENIVDLNLELLEIFPGIKLRTPSPYPSEFNDELKELIRMRDNYTCQSRSCGITQEELGKALDVHHIDGNKNNNNPDNLISLCFRCHHPYLSVGDINA